MAALVEVLCLESFPTHLNPLNVLVLESQFRYAFPNSTEPSSTILFTSPTLKDVKSGILLCAHVTTEEETPESGGADVNNTTLKLYTSSLFLRHHCLPDHIRGAIRLLSPLALSKVVIGARNRQSFKWANSHKFSNGLLVLASCQGHRMLARQGDSLLLPYHPLLGDDVSQVQQYLCDLVVLECTPVKQGMITTDTAVIVADCTELAMPHWATEPPVTPARSLTSLYVSDFAHYVNCIASGSSLLDNKALLGSTFCAFLQALECHLEVKVCDLRPFTDSGLDGDSSVFLSKQMMLKLGLFNQEWVVVSLLSTFRPGEGGSRPGEGVPGPRLARVLVLEGDEDSVGLLSATHWFNLWEGEQVPVGGGTLKIKRWNDWCPPSGPALSESGCRSVSPRYATELQLEVVLSPDYSAHGAHDGILYRHFNIARLVSQGDVLSVQSESHPELLENQSDGVPRGVVVYFRVKSVCGSAETEGKDKGCFLVDTTHTSVYMAGSTNSLAPYACMGLEGCSMWTSLSTPGLSSTVEQLSSILRPHLHPRDVPVLQSGCTVLLHGPCGSGKMTAVRAASRGLHLHLLQVECVSLCADTAASCEAKMSSVFQRAQTFQPCVLLLRNLQLLGRVRDGTEEDGRVLGALGQLISSTSSRVVVIATVCKPRELSADVMSAFVHQVAVQSPSEEQRRAMLASLSQTLPLGKDVSLGWLAKHTAGCVLGDLSTLMTQAGKAAHRRVMKTCFPAGVSVEPQQEEDVCASGPTILTQDFTVAMETLQDAHSQAIGAPKIPSVRWQDVGGLQQVKREILDTVQLPLERPELLSLGLRRAGLLLFGPPGTGKTLLAKAVATECSMTFLSVKGPELLNMYVGQSEENVREVFSKARAAAPCIIFFDELDSLAPNRGRSGDSGGVMDRVVSQLLAELDGLHSSGDVFVIGATNRPDLLDQSLLRPGRFDKLLYVGINEDRETQLQVLRAISRKFQMDPDVSLQEVVERCPAQLTGADLYALCSDAMMAAIKRKIALITDGLDCEQSPLVINKEDFSQALATHRPSISDQQLLKYKHLQETLTAKRVGSLEAVTRA
ncbi:peroxisomal ATPase PEX6 [Aplochiton taeniatus]